MSPPFRSILIATGAPGPDLPAGLTTPLLPVVDRSIVQHVIEFLALQGGRRVDFILHHLPHMVEQALGNGARWGCEFNFHLARNPERPYYALRFIDFSGPETHVVIGSADQLPRFDLQASIGALSGADLAVFVVRSGGEADGEEDPRIRWSGWAVASASLLPTLALDVSYADLERELLSRAIRSGRVIEIEEPLSVGGAKALLAANRVMLERAHPSSPTSAPRQMEGVRLGRNARVHPSAQIKPPVYIGANTQIGRNAHLGPNVVVCPDSVIGDGCILENAIVLPGTYMGPSLCLRYAIADRDSLINVQLCSVVEGVDNLLVRSLSKAESQSPSTLSGRLIALVLALLFLPLVLGAAVWSLKRGSGWLQAKPFVPLPVTGGPPQWRTLSLWRLGPVFSTHKSFARHFLFEFLPGLPQVVAGRIDLAGVSPRDADELARLPPTWRNLILRSKCGLVSESIIDGRLNRLQKEEWAVEAFYSVRQGLRTDLALLASYLRLVLLDLLATRAEPFSRSGTRTGRRQADIL
jgi:NDP-sugar pyrophosphorylase family protein